ncbi:MAG: hypothetical protein VX498_07510 [Myxococcota bacterium]|nr:hypothetical protein [Myxococcota bacterium]
MTSGTKGRKKRPIVLSRHGRYRFQTGMATASLLQRGLPMAEAFRLSDMLREQLRGIAEITSDDLEARLEQLVSEHSDHKAARPRARSELARGGSGTRVRTNHGLLPFSRGILLRYLITAGLDPDEAMDIAQQIAFWLDESTLDEISQQAIDQKVQSLLLQSYGPQFARRHQLTSWIRRAHRPVIILIGGATGTGKSTLATELAFRLGIRHVTSTDMIRETLRTVLPVEVVPGLHDHSFRGMVQGGQVLSDPQERVLAGFRQQAAQVAVGVRATIRRAIREQASLILEGTHLKPPFEHYLPAGADVVCSGLIMAVPEEELHRARFPLRAAEQKLRNPATYLEAFESVRWIHDDLLSAAEDSGCVVVANKDLDVTVTSVIDYLSQSLPIELLPNEPAPSTQEIRPLEPAVPTLFLILDGLADEPNPALAGKTPLEAAKTPTFNRLAGSGGQGLIATGSKPNEAPETDEGLMALLGFGQQIPDMGRGMLEALGQGLPMSPGTIVFRGNLATVADDGTLIDRRAGRIRSGIADLLSGLENVPLSHGLSGHIHAAHEHRVVVMLRGPELSGAVGDTDPGSEAALRHVLAPRPLDKSPGSARACEALTELLDYAHRELSGHPHNETRQERGQFPANCIITRGAHKVTELPRPGATNRTALVSACTTALGVARTLGLEPASSTTMTGNLDTDLDEKFRVAGELLANRRFVVVHVKGTDIAAHDRKPLEKRDFIEAIDTALGTFLTSHPELSDGLRVVISADHGTSSITGNHLPDPVPVLLATWDAEEEEAAAFDETSAAEGALGVLGPGELAEILWTG